VNPVCYRSSRFPGFYGNVRLAVTRSRNRGWYRANDIAAVADPLRSLARWFRQAYIRTVIAFYATTRAQNGLETGELFVIWSPVPNSTPGASLTHMSLSSEDSG
jgi:hypothetical protein